MKKITIILFVSMLISFGVSGTQAATINLYDWGFNVNGAIYDSSGPLPGYFNTGGFDWNTGLGTIAINYNPGVGNYYLLSFFDHEIDEAINTYFNEYGNAIGSPVSGQSWEIDEPGWVFGDIYSNVLSGALDNFNGVPSSALDDVSMALGWDFNLLAGETATIRLILSDTAPLSVFHLVHTDPDSQSSIYFSSTIDIRGGQPIPEPSTLLIVGSGLAFLFSFGRKRFLK